MGKRKIWIAGLIALGLAGGADALAKTAKPPKGYLIAKVEVTDAELTWLVRRTIGPIYNVPAGRQNHVPACATHGSCLSLDLTA